MDEKSTWQQPSFLGWSLHNYFLNLLTVSNVVMLSWWTQYCCRITWDFWIANVLFTKHTSHSGPENLKKSRQKNSWNQINRTFFPWNCIFGSFKLFPSSKIDFWPFLKLQKWNLAKKKIRENDVFDFTSFFALDFFQFSGQLCAAEWNFFFQKKVDFYSLWGTSCTHYLLQYFFHFLPTVSIQNINYMSMFFARCTLKGGWFVHCYCCQCFWSLLSW